MDGGSIDSQFEEVFLRFILHVKGGDYVSGIAIRLKNIQAQLRTSNLRGNPMADPNEELQEKMQEELLKITEELKQKLAPYGERIDGWKENWVKHFDTVTKAILDRKKHTVKFTPVDVKTSPIDKLMKAIDALGHNACSDEEWMKVNATCGRQRDPICRALGVDPNTVRLPGIDRFYAQNGRGGFQTCRPPPGQAPVRGRSDGGFITCSPPSWVRAEQNNGTNHLRGTAPAPEMDPFTALAAVREFTAVMRKMKDMVPDAEGKPTPADQAKIKQEFTVLFKKYPQFRSVIASQPGAEQLRELGVEL